MRLSFASLRPVLHQRPLRSLRCSSSASSSSSCSSSSSSFPSSLLVFRLHSSSASLFASSSSSSSSSATLPPLPPIEQSTSPPSSSLSPSSSSPSSSSPSHSPIITPRKRALINAALRRQLARRATVTLPSLSLGESDDHDADDMKINSHFGLGDSLPMSRYVRLPGEPELFFFRRERISLCAYPEPPTLKMLEQPDSDQFIDDQAERMDAALGLLEKRAAISLADDDDDYKSLSLKNDLRYEKPGQRRQKQKRQYIRFERAQKLMFTLKYLLAMKGRNKAQS